MADFMKLADGTLFEIETDEEAGFELGNIVHNAISGEDGLFVSNKMTDENVSRIEIYGGGGEEVTAAYEDLRVVNVYFDVFNMKVIISLREKTEVEKRLDAIEEEQEIQNEAIDYLAME